MVARYVGAFFCLGAFFFRDQEMVGLFTYTDAIEDCPCEEVCGHRAACSWRKDIGETFFEPGCTDCGGMTHCTLCPDFFEGDAPPICPFGMPVVPEP